MTLAVTPPDAPAAPGSEPQQATDAGRGYDEWRCGLPADAGSEQRERCEDVLPELIVELL